MRTAQRRIEHLCTENHYYPCLESSGFPPACDSCHVVPASPAPWRAPLALAGLSLGCAAGAYGAPAPAQTVVTLPAQEVIGDSVAAARSVLRLPEIERAQADNFASLVDQLPGISMAGSPAPAGKA